MDVEGKKVACIPCHKDSDLLIFIVDLGRGDGATDALTHTFRIGRGVFNASVSCVLKSTLYLFKGRKDGLTAASIDVSKLLVQNPISSPANEIIDLTSESLSYTTCAESPHRRRFTEATPTPGGKIILFSRFIDYSDKNVVDFELYDPKANEWTQLPRINRKEVFSILTVAFLNESTWFIHTDEAGMFVLDLKTKKWQARETLAGEGHLYSHYGSSFIVYKELGGLGFSETAAFDIDESRFGRGFSLVNCLSPILFFPNADPKKGFRNPSVRGAPFLDEDGDLNFCQFQTARDAKTKYPLVTLDIYLFDLASYQEAKKVADHRYIKELCLRKRKHAEDKKKLDLETRSGKEQLSTLRYCNITHKRKLRRDLSVQLPTWLHKSFNLRVDLPEKCSSFVPSGVYFLSS